MQSFDINEEERMECIKKRHEMNNLGNLVLYSQSDMFDHIKSLLVSSFVSSGDTSKTLLAEQERVVKGVDNFTPALTAIEATAGGGRSSRSIKKKSKKKLKKKTKKKLRKKTKKKLRKKTKKKFVGKSKRKIQKGGVNISLLNLDSDNRLVWIDSFSFENENIQKAFILEARAIWEFLVQWKCGITNWNKTGSQHAKSAFPHEVLGNEELKTLFFKTMDLYEDKSGDLVGVYYDATTNMDPYKLAGDLDSDVLEIHKVSRNAIHNQLIKHALLNSPENSDNRMYYYFFHHIGVVLDFLEKYPEFLNHQLRNVRTEIMVNYEDERPAIEREMSEHHVLNRLVYGCKWRPEASFTVKVDKDGNTVFFDTWGIDNIQETVLKNSNTLEINPALRHCRIVNTNPLHWIWDPEWLYHTRQEGTEPPGMAQDLVMDIRPYKIEFEDITGSQGVIYENNSHPPPRLGDTRNPEKKMLVADDITEYFKSTEERLGDRRIQLTPTGSEVKIDYSLPYTKFRCPSPIGSPPHEQDPPTGFKIMMPLLDELIKMLQANDKIEFTMKELILAALWYPNFASCKMISICKRNPDIYEGHPGVGLQEAYNSLLRECEGVEVQLPILEFNLLNKVIDDFAISPLNNDVLNLGFGDWLERSKIEVLYGEGRLVKRITDYLDKDPPVEIAIPALLRGESSSKEDDYLYQKYKKLFKEKLKTPGVIVRSNRYKLPNGGPWLNWTTRKWDAGDGDFLTLDWMGAASFTNNLHLATSFSSISTSSETGSSEYEKSRNFFTKNEDGGDVGNYDNYDTGKYIHNINHQVLERNIVHRIIKIKGKYVMEHGELRIKQGEFFAAGGVLSNASRHGEEYEFIVPEGIILIDRIIERSGYFGPLEISPDADDFLFMEISGYYLHHSLILNYIKQFINEARKSLYFPLTDEGVDELIKRDGGRMVMDLYNGFKKEKLLRAAGTAEAEVADQLELSTHPLTEMVATKVGESPPLAKGMLAGLGTAAAVAATGATPLGMAGAATAVGASVLAKQLLD